jgi:hypothetical protein
MFNIRKINYFGDAISRRDIFAKSTLFHRFDNPHFSLYDLFARDPIRVLFEKNEKGGRGK